MRVAGKSSGLCEIDVPLLHNGDLADDWKIRVDAAVGAFEIGVRAQDELWNLTSSALTVKG